MKRYSFITGCIIALGMTFLWSCNNEETFLDKGVPQGEKGKLSFILPTGGDRAVTYAANSDIDAEFKLSNIRIYWFPDSPTGQLYKRFAHGEGTFAGGAFEETDGESFTAADGQHETIVTITVGDYDQPSRFYIVANVNGIDSVHAAMVKSDPLAKVKVNETTAAEFEALLTDALDAGTVKTLGTPIPMSVSKATTTGNSSGLGYVKVADPSQEMLVNDIHLKRRVARFDVINTSEYSNFEITRIAVSRAQKRGLLFDSPFAPAADSWNADNSYKFEVAAAPSTADPLAFNGPKTANDPDSLHLTKAAFYLYPTVIDNDNLKTEIVLEGIYNKTAPALYAIDLSDVAKYGASQELAIEANKVYRIRVHRATENDMRFELIVDDWTEADTLLAINKGVTINSWGVLKSTATPGFSLGMDTATIADSYEFATSATDPAMVDTLVLVTTGTNLTTGEPDPDKQHVTSVGITVKPGTSCEPGDKAIIEGAQVISKTVKTYGIEYSTTHKIVLPPTNAPVEVELRIANAINGFNSYKVMTLKSNNYAKTGYKPVVMGGLLWAPINVGATVLPATKGTFTNTAEAALITGPHFQWGRNVPFAPFPANWSTVGTISTNKFLSVATANANLTQWCSDANTWQGMTDPGSGAPTPDYTLWEGANAQGPCPTGWRVPTKDEFQAMIDAATRTQGGSATSNYTTFTSKTDATQALYFPFGGARNLLGTSLNNYGTTSPATGIYWTSTIDDGTHVGDSGTPTNKPWRVATNTNMMNLAEVITAGLSIRAVREINP